MSALSLLVFGAAIGWLIAYWMRKKVVRLYVVTDCGDADELRYKVMADTLFEGVLQWAFYATKSMDTLNTGFIGATHVLAEIKRHGPLRKGARVGMLLNAAPRRESGLRGEGRNESGEEIYALRLKNGMWVVGPNAGWNFYFLRDQIAESYLVVDTEGQKTPFRSCYVMLPVLAQILLRSGSRFEFEPKPLELPVHAEPGLYVGGVDSHGNIYIASTFVNESWIPPMGETWRLRVGDDKQNGVPLRHVPDIFSGKTDELTLTTGSLWYPDGSPVNYIVKLGKHAHTELGSPPIGSRIHIEK